MVRHLVITAVLLALLPACTLSNRLFEEDELFIEAVPEYEDLRAEHPASRDVDGDLVDDEGRDVGDPAEVPPVAREIAGNINGLVWLLLAVVDVVMEFPISARTIDGRTWGPYETREGGSARLVVSRDPDDRVFFEYAVALAAPPPGELADDTPWDEVLAGQFARGTGSLREGDGSFCWDADAYAGHFADFAGAGLMCAEHRRTGDRIRLLVTFEDWLGEDGQVRDIAYFFDHREDLGGVLEYRTEGDWIGGAALETSATRVRWFRGGAGRADMMLSGGDVAGDGVPATECWDGQLERVYYLVDPGGTGWDVLEGSEDDCVFPERQEPQQI